MASTGDHAELDRLLAAVLRRRLGQSGPWPAELYRHIGREARAQKLDPAEWLAQVESNQHDLTRLIAAATVGHTGFFRHPDHFEQLKRFAAGAVRRTPCVRVWSLGCATGEEAWSIARCLRELAVPFQVWATDVNPQAIETARRGVYPARNTSGVRGQTQGQGFHAPDELRRVVRFEVAALTDAPSADAPPRFDVIFCRNVLIYLETEAIQDAWSMFLSRVERWGAVVVGPVESLNHVPAQLRRVGPLGWFERNDGHAHVEPQSLRGRSEKPPLGAAEPQADVDTLIDHASRKLAGGDLEGAESDLRRALGRRDDAVGWFLLGETYTRRGELTQAKVAYARSSKAPHVPSNADLETIRDAARRRSQQLSQG